MKLSSRVPDASESFRAQPAILHYKAYLPCCPTSADMILMPIELQDLISRAEISTLPSRGFPRRRDTSRGG
jgi:hypothetical protein